MTTDDRAEKPTDDAPDFPLIEVEVPQDTAQEAARMADKQDLALEDAIARLIVFAYPTDVLSTPATETHSSEEA